MWADHYGNTPAEPMDDPAAKGVARRVVIGPDRGAKNFVMRVFDVEPGGHTPRHRHPFEHEIFVLEGDGVVLGSDGERRVGPGFAVFVPSDEEHQVRNAGNSTLRFICVIPKRSQAT